MEVFFEWGQLMVLCRNGKLFRLREKEIGAKLGILFRKNLFDLATALARRSGQDREALAAIFKQHGDYLYHKVFFIFVTLDGIDSVRNFLSGRL